MKSILFIYCMFLGTLVIAQQEKQEIREIPFIEDKLSTKKIINYNTIEINTDSTSELNFEKERRIALYLKMLEELKIEKEELEKTFHKRKDCYPSTQEIDQKIEKLKLLIEKLQEL